MTTQTLFNLISLRGMREQSFKFAFGYKGGMKQCYTKGCEIFCPLYYAIKDTDISESIRFDQMHEGERPVSLTES